MLRPLEHYPKTMQKSEFKSEIFKNDAGKISLYNLKEKSQGISSKAQINISAKPQASGQSSRLEHFDEIQNFINVCKTSLHLANPKQSGPYQEQIQNIFKSLEKKAANSSIQFL